MYVPYHHMDLDSERSGGMDNILPSQFNVRVQYSLFNNKSFHSLQRPSLPRIGFDFTPSCRDLPLQTRYSTDGWIYDTCLDSEIVIEGFAI